MKSQQAPINAFAGGIKQIALRWLTLLFLLSALSHAQTRINLTTYEFPPYIGQDLADSGAIYQVVRSVFADAGLDVEVSFFPAARAVNSVLSGGYAAVFPVIKDDGLSEDFWISDAIAAFRVGLLGKKHLQDDTQPLTEGITIATVRGSIPEGIKREYRPANFVYVVQNEQALQMLHSGRVDYVLIDQYNAADLMIDKFPYMIGEYVFPPQYTHNIDMHVAFSKAPGRSRLDVIQFNHSLKSLQDSGVIDDIMYEHGLLFFDSSPNKKVLRIATVENADMMIMERMSKEYERLNPDIQLDWRVLDESILRQRLLSDLAMNAGQYDVMTIGAYEVPLWFQRDWLTPLLGLPETYNEDDLIDVIRDSLSNKGNLYALPFYGESSMTYFRTDLFEKAGIEMPASPTWDDIRGFAGKIHNPDEGVYGICLRGKAGWGESLTIIGTMVNTFGGQWFDVQWTPTIDTASWKKAIQFYVDLVEAYGPPDTYKNGFKENLELFANGQCGIWVDATVAAGLLFDENRSEVSDRVWFAPAPVAVTPKGSAWLWMWSLAVPSSSKLKTEAIDFIAWATSQEYIQQVADQEGWVAVPPGTRTSTYQNKEYLKAAPFADYVLSAIERADPTDATLLPSPYLGIQIVTIPEFTAIGNFVSQRISLVLQGQLTIDDALQQSQAFTVNVMKNAAAQ
ncbi:extracellular solute-binding protein [Reinekea blandensis]|uniref:ABC-type sugar transport system, periplasmic component n=1 Tax=Reinekea blandensis MED297 TaxID=314283 RepID=A4BFA2_9GAMM|nr:extracellular solute-binding protein [Reinekea blandensis]EAR09215.1 ABC-type sugar transport system, periplasmic component [Reinekea sp. MED297] [Reinekea blandensis MED297]